MNEPSIVYVAVSTSGEYSGYEPNAARAKQKGKELFGEQLKAVLPVVQRQK